MNYWCRQCNKEVPGNEIEHYHSLGAMHKVCRSGRVVPISPVKKEEKK